MGPNGNEYTFASFDALTQSHKDEFGAAYCDGVETQLGLTAGACTVTGYKSGGSIVVVMSITGSAVVAAKATLTNPVVVQAIAAAGATELSKIEGGVFAATSSSATVTAASASSATPCKPGNHGVLCAVCDLNHARYSSTKPCKPCGSPATAWGWAVGAAILVAIVLALVMIANRKSPTGLLRPIIDLVHRLTVMLMFTAEWPSSLREAGNAISGMMGGNVVEFVSPACIGIGGTFYSRFGLTVGVLAAVITLIWAKAMFSIWRNKRKRNKAGLPRRPTPAAVSPTAEEKLPEENDRSGVRISAFGSANPMLNDSDGDSPWSSPSTTAPLHRPGALKRAASSTSIAIHNTLGLLIPARMTAILSAGQDTIIIILLMYPGVSGHAMQFFRCRNIEGVDYMMVDYGLECYDDAWYGMMVLVVIVLVFLAIGAPVIMVWVLYKKRDQIKAEAKAEDEKNAADAARALLSDDEVEDGEEEGDEKKQKEKGPPADPLTILYKPYRPEVYYYEPIKMGFKLALWCALVAFDEGSEMQLGMALIINTVQLVVHIYLLPLRGSASTPAWQINMLETGSLVVICFRTYIGR